jgi:lysine 2,3-aminomutase
VTQTEPVAAVPRPRHTPVAPAGPPGSQGAQPYEYRRRPLVEPDWTRFPGWRHVSREQWESAQWQRVNCV